MENQSNAALAAAAETAENGANTAQEVSSTTQPIEPTKRSLRVQTWKKIQEGKVGIGFNNIFNRIPAFIDADKAAALLINEEEFKKAQHIKVNIDRALHDFKEQALLADKSVYLPSTRDSSALCLKVDVADDATEEQKKEALRVQDIQKFRTEIGLDSNLKLDIVVIGSVVVSRDGYRIGRGNGFADLDIGLLIELGAITPQTVIATIVHDLQVVDSLPLELFQKYDTPVDIIVTPTEVIRVNKRLPRPNGVFWELLSERRLKILPVLQQLKEREEKSGKTIALKEEDTDVEQHQNNRRRRGPVRRRFQRGNPGRTTSQTDNEQQGEATQKRTPRRKGRLVNRRRRTTKSEGEQSGVEGGAKSEDRKFDEAAAGERRPKKNKNRGPRDFCIKLTNLTRDIRVKDLKSELRKRECNPMSITWKGHFGKCFLHFGNRNGTPSTQDDVDKVLKSLNDLSLTITTGGESTTPAAATAAGTEGEVAVKTEPAEQSAAAPVQTKTINVNVELIKFGAKKNANSTGGGANASAEEGNAAGDAQNGGEAEAAEAAVGGTDVGGGGGGGTRIESVDTTTV